jgi:DNA-binding IclR family transcriptional regulator
MMNRGQINKEVLVEKSTPAMRRLRSRLKKGIALVVLDHATGNGITVAKEEYTAGHAVRFEINFHFPAHVAAPTKAILAALPEREAMQVLDRLNFKRLTPNTITSRAAFEDALAEAADKGYAVDRGEYIEDIQCVSAAVVDDESYPVGAVVCSHFSSQLTEKDFPRIAKPVMAAAREISLSLSNRSRATDSYAKLVIAQAVEYFQEETGINLDVRRYAEGRNIKYSWFRAKFTELMKVSPKQFHLNIKMDKAKHLLRDTDMTVSEIASDLGYGSQSNFSNIFKKKTGVFPSDYRNSRIL